MGESDLHLRYDLEKKEDHAVLSFIELSIDEKR